MVWIIRQGHKAEAGRMCTAAVEGGSAATVQQLSWLLLSAPPASRDNCLLTAAEVTAAFWAAGAVQGWPPEAVPRVMAPPVLQAIDAGFAGRVAAVQRLLFKQQLQPLLMWMQRAVVEDFGRPDAAAEACWDLMQLGAGHVVAEVSALVIVEGHYGTAAPVSRELYRLEHEKHRQLVAGDALPPASAVGREVAKVLAAANIQAAEAGTIAGVVEVVWRLYSDQQLSCLVDTQVAMALDLSRPSMAGKISWAAIQHGRAEAVVEISARLLLAGHSTAAAAIAAELYHAAIGTAAEGVAAGPSTAGTAAYAVAQPASTGLSAAVGGGTRVGVTSISGNGGNGSSAAARVSFTPGLPAGPDVAMQHVSGAAKHDRLGRAGVVVSKVPAPAASPVQVAPTGGLGHQVAPAGALGAPAGVEHCPIAAAAAKQGTSPRIRAARSPAHLAAGPESPRAATAVSAGRLCSPQVNNIGLAPRQALSARGQPGRGAAVAALAQANLRAIDGGAVQHAAFVVILLWQRHEVTLLRDLIVTMAAPPLARPDAAARVSWAVIERGQGAAVAEVSAAVVVAGRIAEAARVMEDMADIAGLSPHLIKMGGDTIVTLVHSSHSNEVVELTQLLLDDGYSGLLNNITTHLIKEGHSDEMGQVSTAALGMGKPGVVAELSAVLASPKEGDGPAPGALAAVAGKTVKQGFKRLGQKLKHAIAEE
ncbi:hypothetical protein N2152v2_001009 [Parachlorella kessleri]